MLINFINFAIGAGEHKEHNYLKYNKLSKSACKKAIDILNQGGNALDAVKAAVMGMFFCLIKIYLFILIMLLLINYAFIY